MGGGYTHLEAPAELLPARCATGDTSADRCTLREDESGRRKGGIGEPDRALRGRPTKSSSSESRLEASPTGVGERDRESLSAAAWMGRKEQADDVRERRSGADGGRASSAGGVTTRSIFSRATSADEAERSALAGDLRARCYLVE